MKRLAILSTHPIQYNAPLYRMLHDEQGLDVKVFFSKTWDQVKYDPDFQREITWDIPISKGYPHSTHDASTRPGQQALAAAIRDFQPHALLVYGWNFPGHFATIRQFHGRVPIWFRGDSHLLNPMPIWKKAMRRAMLTWVYHHVDVAFTVGTANEAYYRWSGLKKSQLIRAPHAVDNDFWLKNDTQREALAQNWRSSLGISRSTSIIGFAGKLEPLKQVGKLIDAVLLSSEAHLVIAGTGALEQDLKAHYSNSARIHFLGFVNQSQMPVFYRMLDLLALVSNSETWGLCLNEAILSGAKVLTSDRVGASLDIFDSGAVGHTVSSEAGAESWRQGLEHALTLSSDVSQSRQLFSGHFSHDKMVTAILQQFKHDENE